MTQREAFEAWWGQAPVELQPLQPRTREDTLSAWVWEAWQAAQAAQPAQVQINCDDCVYHYKDADQKPCAMCIHGTGLYDNFEPRIPAAQEVK